MAIITWSGIGITEGRGKSGNKIYSRNRGGNYEKGFANPFFPNSDSQQIINQAIADVVALWQGITDDMRQEWIIAASNDPSMSRLGKSFNLSGYNLFCQQTFNILIAGGIPTLLPAAKTLVRLPTAITVNTLDPLTFNVSLQVAGAAVTMPNNIALLLFATTSISAGITSKKSGYAGFFSRLPTQPLQNLDVYGEYSTLFPAPITGEKIFLRARVYHQVSGQSSEYLYTSAIVS